MKEAVSQAPADEHLIVAEPKGQLAMQVDPVAALVQVAGHEPLVKRPDGGVSAQTAGSAATQAEKSCVSNTG